MKHARITVSALACMALSLFLLNCGGDDVENEVFGSGWEQFMGRDLTIHFISENTPPSSALSEMVDVFYEKTGIRVIVEQLTLDDMVQKVALDFSSKTGNYEMIYVDSRQVLAPFYKNLVTLNTFMADETLPQLPEGLEDFFPTQLEEVGRMLDEENLYALPYDTPTMIWFYRTDIFEKYGKRFQADEGFDWTPGSGLSWEQYYTIAKWINENVPKSEVRYGTGHQAKQHDALNCDFAGVMWAYGGDYFKNVSMLGMPDPGPCTLTSKECLEAARFYKKLLDIAHPGSVSWDWNGLAEAFAAGEVAMCPQWHEYSGMLENPELSKVAGNVGYSLLPHGPSGKSMNMWGGSGIGINGFASPAKKRAAWMFLVWATSPEVQFESVRTVGGTPTRISVFEMPEIKKAMTRPSALPGMLSTPAVLMAWEDEQYFGLRPKTPYWLRINNVVFTQLSGMLAGAKSPEQAMKDAARQVDEITGN